MGEIYSTFSDDTEVAVAATGRALFVIKPASSNGVRLRSIDIVGIPGVTSAPQSQTFRVRMVRGATTATIATQGGTELGLNNLHPLGRTAVSTVVKLPSTATGSHSPTEGGICLYSSVINGAKGESWSWSSADKPELAYWCDKSSNLSVLVHPTDTTVFSGRLVFEEMSKGS